MEEKEYREHSSDTSAELWHQLKLAYSQRTEAKEKNDTTRITELEQLIKELSETIKKVEKY